MAFFPTNGGDTGRTVLGCQSELCDECVKNRPNSGFFARGLAALFRHRFPFGVGVVCGHSRRNGIGLGAEVCLKNFSFLINDKGHNTGIAPFRRPCDQRKSRHHVTVYDVVVFPAGRVPSLACQNLEVITVIGGL